MCNEPWTYHPAKPQAGLTGSAQGDIGRGDVRRGLQGLNFSGRLTGRTGAHNVYLTHSEPEGKEKQPMVEKSSKSRRLIMMIWEKIRLDYFRLD